MFGMDGMAKGYILSWSSEKQIGNVSYINLMRDARLEHTDVASRPGSRFHGVACCDLNRMLFVSLQQVLHERNALLSDVILPFSPATLLNLPDRIGHHANIPGQITILGF